MGRSQNALFWEIEQQLADRDAMRAWVREAQALTPFVRVTDRDWLFWGHLSPREWVCEFKLDRSEADLRDEWETDLYGDEWDDPYEDHLPYDFADMFWDEPPAHLEFGGRLYPRHDILDARARLGDSTLA